MRKRLTVLAVLVVAALAISAGAYAFDCIRVSSSLQGLQQSTKSGNWLLFDLSTAQSTQETFTRVIGEEPPLELAACVSEAYAAYHVSPFFALGVGVAGGRTGHGTGVLASGAPDKVLSDLRGVDHLEQSPVGAALFGALATCGIDVDEE